MKFLSKEIIGIFYGYNRNIVGIIATAAEIEVQISNMIRGHCSAEVAKALFRFRWRNNMVDNQGQNMAIHSIK